MRQEFGKRWSGRDPDYYKKSSVDARNEAEPANYAIVNLLIQGMSSQTVVIERVTVKPVSVLEAQKRLRLQTGGVRGPDMSRFLVDLDARQPRLKFKDGRD